MQENNISVLLVADYGNNKDALLGWCIEHEFEHVAMATPAMTEADEDTYEEDADICGMPRVREALESHMWECMVRKGNYGLIMLFICDHSTLSACAG